MAADDMQTQLESIVEPVCRAHGVELVDVRHIRQKGGAVLRVIIDRPRVDGVDGSGVSVDDCTDVSRDLSSALDVHEELLPGSYNLEVSSPGLERPLVKLHDFDRFAGREAQIRTKVRVGERRKFKGTLLGVTGETIRLEDKKSGAVEIPYEAVSKANLVYRF